VRRVRRVASLGRRYYGDVKLELHKMNKQWDQAAMYMAGVDSSILGKPEPSLDARQHYWLNM
jgi:hypothetical protein